MTATTASRGSRAAEFAVGFILSGMIAGGVGAIAFSAASTTLGAIVFIALSLLVPAKPLVSLAIFLLVPIAVATWFLVRGNSARIAGAVAFYPVAAVAYLVAAPFVAAHADRVERRAMELDYSGRTIAHPLGTIEVLGLPGEPVVCWQPCAQLLLDGVASEIAAISYAVKVDFAARPIDDKLAGPWIFRRHRLRRGEDCLTPGGPLSWTGANVSWLQQNGIFDVCIVSSVGSEQLGGMVLIEQGERAQRDHGPVGGAAVAAYRIENGERSEIARWEYGTYPRSHKAVGTRFTTQEFVVALSGEAHASRMKNSAARSLREAVERIHAHLPLMPNFAGSTFEFIRETHGRELGFAARRTALDDDVAAKLIEAAQVICRERIRDLTSADCFYRYNAVINVIFAPDKARELRLTG